MYLQGIEHINAKAKTVRHASCLLIHACLFPVNKCDWVGVRIAEFDELVGAWRSSIYSFKFIFPCTCFEVAVCEQTILMNVCLFSDCLYSLLFWLHGSRTLSSGKVGLANLIDSHDHLVYLACISFGAFSDYCWSNLAVSWFSLPVIP